MNRDQTFNLNWHEKIETTIRETGGGKHRTIATTFINEYYKELNNLYDTVIEVGTGCGYLIDQLYHINPQKKYYGIDLNPEIIRKNRARYPGVDFLAGEAAQQLKNIPSGNNALLVAISTVIYIHPNDLSQLFEIMNQKFSLWSFVFNVYTHTHDPEAIKDIIEVKYSKNMSRYYYNYKAFLTAQQLDIHTYYRMPLHDRPTYHFYLIACSKTK